MPGLELRSPLTAEERAEKRKLIMRDVTALLTLFVIAAVLATLTWLLFSSFSTHRKDLAQRWLQRGRTALASGRPDQAVNALRAALEYQEGAPVEEQRQTEIDLASALAASGRDNEAIAYFNSLLEAAPGNGTINLELARLAAKQGHEAQAVESYQRALDGVWNNGDGYQRRLDVRLELSGYLVSEKDFSRAQSELLIAAGNAQDEPGIKLHIAGMMEQANDPQSAFGIYRRLATERHPQLEALEGAGRTAAALGHFQVARQFYARALGDFALDKRPSAERDGLRSQLASVSRTLAIYPDPDLTPRARAERVVQDVAIARNRMTQCSPASLATDASNASGSENAAPAVPAALGALMTRWQQVPAGLNPRDLEDETDLQQTLMTLVYDTEKLTAQTCGQPSGNDALLLGIANAPWAAE